MSGRAPEHPIRRPVVHQSWRRVTFLHWPTDPGALDRLLPEDLEPDLVDGRAWVAITPFEVRRARPAGLPPLPGLASFPETNVRTYVRHRNGDDGLWFLSLDVGNTLNVLAGRLIGAPYFRSQMSVSEDGVIRYCCRRARGGASHDIAVRAGAPIEPDAVIDHLTGRWRAFTTVAGRMLQVPVAHQPWPLRSAEVVSLDESLIATAGLPPPTAPPVAHHSDGVDARLGRPRPCRAQ